MNESKRQPGLTRRIADWLGLPVPSSTRADRRLTQADPQP